MTENGGQERRAHAAEPVPTLGSAATLAEPGSVRNLWGVRTPMRDGITLVGDLYLPDGPIQPYPSVVIRTPYNKQNRYYPEPARYLASYGYAVLVQDVRGRCDSEGEFYPFFNNEGPDGYDTIEWVAEQPWSNGRVGMMSGSYCGWVQWCAAAMSPPHLVTFVSASAATRWFQQVPYHNGVPVMGPALQWLFGLRGHANQDGSLFKDWAGAFQHLPLHSTDEFIGTQMPVWREWVEHSTFDEFWQGHRLKPEDFAAVTQPVLHITSTYDGTQPGELATWCGALEHSPAADKQHMLFGYWEHLGAASSIQKTTQGGVDFGPDSVIDVNDLHRRWFDRYLKESREPGVSGHEAGGSQLRAHGSQLRSEFPRARVYFTGVNRWEDADDWPPARGHVAWYLHSGGSANSAAGNGSLSTEAPRDEPDDSLLSDPNHPVTDVPDIAMYSKPPDPFSPLEAPLVRDFVESRQDVLVYTSLPQERDLAIAGEPWVVLFGGSDCPDTDWHAWLADVAPDGTSLTLVRGQLCARFRDSLEEEHFMEPGVTYKFEFELLSLAHVFRAGHRIRFVIGPSDFPTYARNQNTGHRLGMDDEVRVARNVVRHSGEHASHALLPVYERD